MGDDSGHEGDQFVQDVDAMDEDYDEDEITPETEGRRWGDPISSERQAELQGYLDHWKAETDQGERKGLFDGVRLTGADVSWLAEQLGT